MQIDPAEDRTMMQTLRQHSARKPWLQLLTAVLHLAGGKAELLRHSERPWASVTFSGTRHTIALSFSGTEAVAAGEVFIVELPDHEFAISRQIVADAAITAVEHKTRPEPNLTVEVELLLLDDG